MSDIDQLRKGSTTLLILNLLSEEKMYGYKIMRELKKRSQGYFTMTAASLYPALHQLEQDGLVAGEWGQGDERRRKYYTITNKGRKVLQENKSTWRTFVDNLFKTLNSPPIKLQDGEL
jgi:PadR family transcriptional regulator PadR